MKTLTNRHIHFIGIKGSGCTALAELLTVNNTITGSDTAQKFYTDKILDKLKIPYNEGFTAANIPTNTDLVIYSGAYNQSNPEYAAALNKFKLNDTMLSYPQALGLLSAGYPQAVAVAGVHGKTTTTALIGHLVKGLNLKMDVLAGSAVSSFDGGSSYSGGCEAFIAETCEYRRHFLNFKASHLVITAIEHDHQDYYPSYQDIEAAFTELALQLPPGGTLIYCADDVGASQVATLVSKQRSDLIVIPYGFTADNNFKIESCHSQDEQLIFKLKLFAQPLALPLAGRHNSLNTAAALAVLFSLNNNLEFTKIKELLANFTGVKRRGEVIAKINNLIIMDDYAHHPTAIKATLTGLKQFYPNRRLVVSFMSHTYSRTAALFNDFAASFNAADVLLLHKIFASAREKNSGGIDGKALSIEAKKHHKNVHYYEEPLDEKCLDFLLNN
ncbi:MAG: UDP-N-acetylmuramate--L-alanine ligase, partial [Spirochaetaceae bacterium]|nr:UDP-N-acetylmuramate--L-alanine ligase [Spirochaetaceae bacterium]